MPSTTEFGEHLRIFQDNADGQNRCPAATLLALSAKWIRKVINRD